MSIFSAWLDGARRVNRAPMILIGVWAMTLLVSLPLTIALRGTLARHLGASLAADSAASGVNYDWMQEFGDQASGLGGTFKPTVLGFGAVLDNLSGFLDDTARPLVIVGAGSAYVLLWIFAAGGILDRYARDRPTRAHGFFAVSGVFFFRFARLAAVQWCVYAILFVWIHPLLFDRVFVYLTRNMTVERTAFFTRAGLYAVFGLLLAGCNLIFDYAKVRAVVEDRRSMLGAISAALGFVAHNAAAAMTLYATNAGLFLATIAIYAAVAPNGGGGGRAMWIGLALGQIYIGARLWIKLVFWASETALYQQRLAHAGYVARPQPVWPESPSAEALSERVREM